MSDTTDARADDPRLKIGGNSPPISEQLKLEYETIEDDAVEANAEAGRLPFPVKSAEDVMKYADHAQVIKAVQTRVAAAEEKEKRPFMNAVATVRAHFGAWHNANKTGTLDRTLETMRVSVKTWQDAERARVAAEAAAKAAAAREEERKREQAAAEAAAKLAEQARQKAEAEAAAKAASAPAPAHDTTATVAAAVEVHENLNAAGAAASFARHHENIAAAKPGEQVRVRSAVGGGGATMEEFWTFEVLDYAAVPAAELWALIPDKVKHTAIGKFVDVHKGSRTLPGVRIFQDTRTKWQ